GGDVLEKVHQLDTIVFDKTGTLTVGHPSVTDCIPLTQISPQRLLQLAATVESGTNHPLSIAILDAAQAQELELLKADNFQTEAGRGVSATVAGKSLLLGNEQWLKEQGIDFNGSKTWTDTGKTLVYLGFEGEVQGIIALKDNLRPDAQETVTRLQEKGLEVILVSGDRLNVVQTIAQQLGITKVFAEVRPQDKATIIERLQQKSEPWGLGVANGEKEVNSSSPSFPRKVAMIGDGINDAPALAQADLGISLQGATEVALETADIVLMGNHLLDVIQAIDLSLSTFTKIRQNLLWALGYNILVLPIAAGILLPSFGLILSPALAGALMACSSITVVTNSLLLRRQFSSRPEIR
ncbi:MAG TPA: heavy metal translocating P-type ATPase, partial [Cyanothece sp. UBA12306]|nr:heavy metal translocating P-type ATPase [Cyanothece sp. UBA12306]